MTVFVIAVVLVVLGAIGIAYEAKDHKVFMTKMSRHIRDLERLRDECVRHTLEMSAAIDKGQWKRAELASRNHDICHAEFVKKEREFSKTVCKRLVRRGG